MRRTSLVLAGACLAGTVASASARDLQLAGRLPVMVVGTLFVIAGTVATTRRPGNPSGRLLGLAGLAWLLSMALSTVDSTVASTVGFALLPLGLAPLAHLALAFPGGRLRTRLERRLAVSIYAVAVGCLPIVGTSTCEDCGAEAAGLDIRTGVGRIWYSVLLVAVLAVTVGVLAVLVSRWRRASPASRRILLPVVPGAGLFAAVYAAAILTELGVPTGLGERWVLVGFVLIVVAPLAFLGGVLRSRLTRGGISRQVVELGESPPPHGLRDALALALGDPSLQLAYWRADGPGYVDPGGSPLALPADGSGRSVAVVERRGRRVGALVYDAAVQDDPALVDSVSAAAGLAMENESLHAEVLARLEEVRTSRARIVLAGDQARRQVERDLHDGAQQRLVAVAMAVGSARARLDPAVDPVVADLLRRAADDAALALRELRELAQGLHPSVLTEAGLAIALDALAERSTVPVTVTVQLDGRVAAPVEAAAYFVVAEALANVAKHAGASAAEVRVSRQSGRLLVEVVDDGVGGAAARPGSGLEGLADRVAALDGRIEIDSHDGGGTRVRVELPCG